MRGLNLKEIMSKSNMNQQGLNIATYRQAYYGLVRHFGKSTWEELSCPAQMPNLARSSAQAAIFAPKHRKPKNEKLTCS